MRGRSAWLAALALLAALAFACGGGEDAPVAVTPALTCTQETLGVDPATNDGLKGDCDALLKAKAALDRTDTLNWSAGTALTSWDGVTVSGTPTRVTGLNLSSLGLEGSLMPGLGNLRELTTLRLDGNRLTGIVPPKLGWLTNLTDLSVDGNRLTGCLPPAWGDITNTDLSSTNLPACPPPTAVDLQDAISTPGTYAAVNMRPIIIFDLPPGLSLRLTALMMGAVASDDDLGEPGSLQFYEFTHEPSGSVITFTAAGKEDGRAVNPEGVLSSSEAAALDRLLDQLSESVWSKPEP